MLQDRALKTPLRAAHYLDIIDENVAFGTDVRSIRSCSHPRAGRLELSSCLHRVYGWRVLNRQASERQNRAHNRTVAVRRRSKSLADPRESPANRSIRGGERWHRRLFRGGWQQVAYFPRAAGDRRTSENSPEIKSALTIDKGGAIPDIAVRLVPSWRRRWSCCARQALPDRLWRCSPFHYWLAGCFDFVRTTDVRRGWRGLNFLR